MDTTNVMINKVEALAKGEPTHITLSDIKHANPLVLWNIYWKMYNTEQINLSNEQLKCFLKYMSNKECEV